MQRRLLGALLVSIVARLEQRLQIALVPEQPDVATMRDLVVADEQRSVAFNLLTAALAREAVPNERR